MASFRLTDGSGGCPPTEDPTADYEIPFRFDSAGRLWINGCFKSLQYFGAARHDIPDLTVLNGASTPNNTAEDLLTGDGVTAGTYTPLSITNDTNCDIGILLGHDVTVDMSITAYSLMSWILSARWNGVHQSFSRVSGVVNTTLTGETRLMTSASANPHDVAIEDGDPPSLTIAPGATATVSARMYMSYVIGTPNGNDVIHSAYSAVRVYGYTL